jgi:hypothetical protein
MMATVQVKRKDKLGEFLSKFYPTDDCTGTCMLCYDQNTGWYVPCAGQDGACGACTCPSIGPNFASLLKIKGFDLSRSMTVPCSSSMAPVPEAPIQAYIELLLRFKLALRLAIGFGISSALLIAAVIYLLIR